MISHSFSNILIDNFVLSPLDFAALSHNKDRAAGNFFNSHCKQPTFSHRQVDFDYFS
jgi:hypothetical protein